MMPSLPAHALVPVVSEAAPPQGEPAVEQVIETLPDEGDDELIAERIRGIFAELPAFQNVSIEVNEGVVSLSGSVADPEAIQRAANIAGRVTGVVTVENAIERDLSVQENLSVLGRLSEISSAFLSLLPLLVVAGIVAAVVGGLGYLIAGFSGLWDRIAPNAFLAELIRSAIRFLFVIGGLVIALDMLGAGALMGAVLGGAGVIGIALSFAMRDTIENYIASLMLSIRQPFRANDWVLIDTYEGRVIRLTSRATILMTLDGNHLRIPNGQVFKAVILNYTRNPQRRFDFVLGVDADDDPRGAMQIGAEALAALPFVLKEPEAVARIEDVGDSNISIRFLAWINQDQADWYKSRSLAIAAVKDALEQAGYALPEPIYRLRVDARSEALPLGRGMLAAHDKPPEPVSPVASGVVEQDVRPESEITEMVEKERLSEAGQAKDLLDANRPVE
ncbi:mechanosensitive ion channel family protein [Altererythrobacter lutimaris]|uniref:Small-conductance mechanosensitive channel n=1 Tax=Altererythrobacter lutimaris TaxID=2743979 RepID=A0A850HAN6_9SPHN|nr:mechanosensitive ion channel family protein [Altererythrobacter lutimaris]NVE95073.1 mechanosensitive ion channel [Altererythrobacter lutimaris]